MLCKVKFISPIANAFFPAYSLAHFVSFRLATFRPFVFFLATFLFPVHDLALNPLSSLDPRGRMFVSSLTIHLHLQERETGTGKIRWKNTH